MTLSPKLARAISRPLPHAAMGISFVTGQPSLALPDTDGRHDRSGHGTWVLLAVFVVHVCRPWLSVTGYDAERLTPVRAEMDPRACDGWTTVRPLWLFGVRKTRFTASPSHRRGIHRPFACRRALPA